MTARAKPSAEVVVERIKAVALEFLDDILSMPGGSKNRTKITTAKALLKGAKADVFYESIQKKFSDFDRAEIESKKGTPDYEHVPLKERIRRKDTVYFKSMARELFGGLGEDVLNDINFIMTDHSPDGKDNRECIWSYFNTIVKFMDYIEADRKNK